MLAHTTHMHNLLLFLSRRVFVTNMHIMFHLKSPVFKALTLSVIFILDILSKYTEVDMKLCHCDFNVGVTGRAVWPGSCWIQHTNHDFVFPIRLDCRKTALGINVGEAKRGDKLKWKLSNRIRGSDDSSAEWGPFFFLSSQARLINKLC